MPQALSFIKGALALMILIPSLSYGEGIPFKISAPIPQDYSSQRLKFLSEMKHRAVLQWLRQNAPDSSEVVNSLKPADTEQYVIDYTLGRARVGGVNSLELSGNLDGKALRRWILLNSAKSSASTSGSLFILSSAVEENRLYPQETFNSVKGKVFGQTLVSSLNEGLSKLKTELAVINLLGFPLASPARKPGEVSEIANFGPASQYSTSTWAHLTPCQSCGGGKLTVFFYNLKQGRILFSVEEDVAFKDADLYDSAKLKESFAPLVEKFRKKYEDTLGGGTFNSTSVRLLVQGVNSYLAFRRVASGVEQIPSVSQAIIDRAVPGGAEFEVLTSLSPDDLSKQLSKLSFPDFRLEVVQIDSNALIVRYLGLGNKSPASLDSSESVAQ